MMIRLTNIPILLLCAYIVFLPLSGTINNAFAAQDNIKQELYQFLQQGNPGVISGKVTDVIKAGGITYTEVDTGKDKIWSAGMVETAPKKGDIISFTTETPMHNFHSKALQRDFSLIYFVKQYISDKETSVSPPPFGLLDTHKTIRPTATPGPRAPVAVETGGYLRPASLDGLNAKNKSLADFRGKPLIINVWASWCGPCRAEMGSLDRLAKRYNGESFNIIGISTDDYRDKAAAFIRQTDISFENYLDNKLFLENMLGATTIPLTILVSADGKVLNKIIGAREWDSPEIVEAIGRTFGISLE